MADTPSQPPLDAGHIQQSNVTWREPLRLVGKRKEGFQVVYGYSALASVRSHGRTDTSVEIAGVLVGEVRRDKFGLYLAVTDTIPAAKAASKGTQVTFTAEAWDHIQTTMDRHFPAKQIVGWYHTHPGFGVFLSGMDLFIQDNFFNEPHQVALVVDPLGGDEGTFVWRDGAAVREDHLVDENVPTLAAARPRRKLLAAMRDSADRLGTRQRTFLALLGFVFTFMGAYALMVYIFPPRNEVTLPAAEPTTNPSGDAVDPADIDPLILDTLPPNPTTFPSPTTSPSDATAATN